MTYGNKKSVVSVTTKVINLSYGVSNVTIILEMVFEKSYHDGSKKY